MFLWSAGNVDEDHGEDREGELPKETSAPLLCIPFSFLKEGQLRKLLKLGNTVLVQALY